MEKLFVYIFDLYEKSNVNRMLTFEQPLNKLLIVVRNSFLIKLPSELISRYITTIFHYPSECHSVD